MIIKIIGVGILCSILFTGCQKNQDPIAENPVIEEIVVQEVLQVPMEKHIEEEGAEAILRIQEVDYSDVFQGINGCVVFYDEEAYKIYNQSLAIQQKSPYSTFKIISTLIGLENDIIQDENSTMGYNGTIYSIQDWNKEVTLREAFQASCVWYYKKVIDKIDPSTMQEHLIQLSYGNEDIGEWNGSGTNPLKELNGFWLGSSLQISPKEQVEVLAKLFNEEMNYKAEHIQLLKDMMEYHKEEGLTIFGKTGTGKEQGWFVGMLLHEDKHTYFAVFLEDKGVSGAQARDLIIKIINQDYK